MTGAELAASAQALEGVAFRLHGRDPASGLDCIGLLAAALERCGQPVALPNGYRLRAHCLPPLDAIASESGFTPAAEPFLAGDVLMVRVGPCQFHLLIMTSSNRCIHAHAGLGRAVLCQRPADWPVVSHWRLSPKD